MSECKINRQKRGRNRKGRFYCYCRKHGSIVLLKKMNMTEIEKEIEINYPLAKVYYERILKGQRAEIDMYYSHYKHWHKIACILGALFGFSFCTLIGLIIILLSTKI